MGNYVSKCCGLDGKKYKKKTEMVNVAQPEQDDPNAKVATNTGATMELPSDKTVTPDTKEDVNAEKDKKDKEQKDDKKQHKKHTRRKQSESSNDSSDFWSSSSSESSDSDSDTGHTKSSRKVYKNKGGGTTIISKKTVIGGHKMSIGKNAKNLTINIGSNPTPPRVNKSNPPRQEKEKKKPFESYYSESRAREEEQRQFASLWEQPTAPPGGNFIDTRDAHAREYVFESSVRVDASDWVCMICFPGGGTGTGFRVGTKYIMTANHVVKHILDAGYHQVGQTQDPFSRLQDSGVYAVFNYKTDGQITDRQKFQFKAVVPFRDDATDTAILELEANAIGTPMPLYFTFFSLPRLNNRFTFIGHSEGKRMEFNHVDRIIDMNSEETQRDIVRVKQMSLQHSGKDYEVAPFNTLTNPHRYLFHCKFTKGASGSPGVVILDNARVVVVTMLLCGLPDWYYDMSIQDNIKNNWPKEYCVEQGVNLKSVYDKMRVDNPTLCREIFGDHTDSIPNPNI